MRMSQMLHKTFREAPAEADLPSHQLLIRAGLIQALAAGLYCFTPFGWRVFRRIENIIREEMDRSGAQEVHLPALHPIELWKQSGRDQLMGLTLFRLTDRRERGFALGPTHEEVISYLASRTVQSYRDMPITLYQIQTKFRDETRPRGGLIRLREFTMKDAYSFDASWEALDTSYDAAFEAYERIFSRAGVPVMPVAADSGAIGGKDSQEFIFISDNGEDEILICGRCGYAANSEKADLRKPPPIASDPRPIEKVPTPGATAISDLVEMLGVEAKQTAKAVFNVADGKPVFVVIRGDLDVNEVKLKNVLKANELEAMDESTVISAGLVAGSASAVGLRGMKVIADPSAVEGANLVAGANEPDAHFLNVNHGRDWTADLVADIALARPGDGCPECDSTLESRRGMEMGHVFKLGTTYSESMGVEFVDVDGSRKPAVMGCYGIGVERLLAAVIEANHDEDGICWPAEVAPFDVHVVVLNQDEDAVAESLSALESSLSDFGLNALIDDRDESPGVKFKDADLMGIPVRLTVSPRALGKGGLEIRDRTTRDQDIVPVKEAGTRARDLLAQH
ncbi:MAG TPA: proline--tRNA ligase [Dehalococcoidia bacterium]|nr:proline--tRNA ligase [Dehalococcoidia bacterium]